MGLLDRLFGPPAQECEQPPLVLRPSLEEVVVRIQWLTPEQMASKYPGECGNTVGPFIAEDGRAHVVIRAVQPEDFNDIPRLVTLGHELFHALGATHTEERA